MAETLGFIPPPAPILAPQVSSTLTGIGGKLLVGGGVAAAGPLLIGGAAVSVGAILLFPGPTAPGTLFDPGLDPGINDPEPTPEPGPSKTVGTTPFPDPDPTPGLTWDIILSYKVVSTTAPRYDCRTGGPSTGGSVNEGTPRTYRVVGRNASVSTDNGNWRFICEGPTAPPTELNNVDVLRMNWTDGNGINQSTLLQSGQVGVQQNRYASDGANERWVEVQGITYNETPQPLPEPLKPITPSPKPRPKPIQPAPLKPQPQPQPAPGPLPEPQPQPEPQPAPKPVKPSPAPPQPVPGPLPVPSPLEVPNPAPLPVPLPQPVPVPVPSPEPTPVAPPAPQPQPQPVPGPVPEPITTPQPGTSPLPEPVPLPEVPIIEPPELPEEVQETDEIGEIIPLPLPPVLPTPDDEHFPVPGQPGVTPGGTPPTLEGIASEVGRIEQKSGNLLAQGLDIIDAINDIQEILGLGGPADVPAQTLEMRAACDYDNEGDLAKYSVSYPAASPIQAVLDRVNDIPSFLEQHLAWKTPTCDDKVPLEGDRVTIRWVSDAPSPYSNRPLRKRFGYRTKSSPTLPQLREHWRDFTWQAGPVCVSHAGGWWGSPQVWASTADEGKRVINHAAAEAGIDTNKVGKWLVSGSRSARYGVPGTMRIEQFEGIDWITSRDGPSAWPEI